MRPVSRRAVWICALSVLAALFVTFGDLREARAVPSFARKYQTSCLTCHTVYPVLNPFGEAFRRNGYRFPSQNGSVDSDAVRIEMIPLGQEEYKKEFPHSVWPSKIPEDVPFSVMVNGTTSVNFPNSDAHTAGGQTFTWGGTGVSQGLVGEFHLFAAGAFNDNFTYFSQVTIPSNGSIDVETAYVLWNDIVGPAHAVNVWLGRLMNPQLNSFGLHSSYVNDTFMPAVSVAGLYNPTNTFTLGQGHADGIEANGILFHRFNWSLGWIASSAASGLSQLNAEDVYAHIGIKSGGVALDGEGKYGPNVPNPKKPWAEKSITFDLFGYHGMGVADNGTGNVSGLAAPTPGAPAITPNPVGQHDTFYAVGGSLRAQYDSWILTSGLQLERHAHPYPGTPATPNAQGGAPIPGVPDTTDAKAIVQYNELDFVVFPWLVPALRTELTRTTFESSNPASLLRVIPGVAMLVRPDIKVVITGDIERGYGLPPTGAWTPAGGNIVPRGAGQSSMFEAEQINATMAIAF